MFLEAHCVLCAELGNNAPQNRVYIYKTGPNPYAKSITFQSSEKTLHCIKRHTGTTSLKIPSAFSL